SAGGFIELLDREAIGMERFLRRSRYAVGRARDMQKVLHLDVEDVAGRGLRDDQRVPGGARHDVEESKDMVVLVDLGAGKFAAQDFCKDVVAVIGGHGGGS